ncbi:ribonuclease HIII [Mycoplasma sp. 4463]|uniref:ribonuclease HIII n=1 Tax=Mycoplasma sp. 4463 TaxID=3400998 RepID=UPI003AAB5956
MKYIDDIKQLNVDLEQVIGVDETGVGDYWTPLVSCAVYLPNKLKQFVASLGVKDSKKLSDKQILSLAPRLMEFLEYSVYTLTQAGYNKLSKSYNANELKFFTHASALSTLAKKYKIQATAIIIDKYSTTNSILKYHQKFFIENNWAKLNELQLPTLLVNKAEDIHLSVACASIIGRYHLLQYMEEQSKNWNFNFLLGASKHVVAQIHEFTQTYGESSLNSVLKLNFKIK